MLEKMVTRDGESAAAILGHITPRKRDAAEGN